MEKTTAKSISDEALNNVTGGQIDTSKYSERELAQIFDHGL